jgi:hypothetical protein
MFALAVLQAKLAGDGNCCFCFEPLPSAAVIALQCQAGHFVHLSCAKQRLQVRMFFCVTANQQLYCRCLSKTASCIT